MRSKWLDIAVLIVLMALSSLSFAHAASIETTVTGTSETKSANLTSDTKSGGHMSTQLETAPPEFLIEQYMIEGNLTDGESKLTAYVKRHPSDDSAKFGLGMLQFIRGIEHIIQDMYRYGLRYFPFQNLESLESKLNRNRSPESLSYNDFRMIVKRFSEKIAQSEKTLSEITDPNVKLPVHFGRIRIDIDGNGRYGESESLDKIYAGLQRIKLPDDAKDFYIKFDRGDVHWLRGYCNLLSAICQVYLAYDSKETFNSCAHVFFRNAETPYKFLNKDYVTPTGEDKERGFRNRTFLSDHAFVLDLIELIHSVRWEVVEPERMKRALHHLENVVAQSHISWDFIMAETDDDHEWLPNPRQTGVIPDVKVTEAMVTAWRELMDKIDLILQGKLLIAFWRADDRGINLRRFFLEPRRLDLVSCIQGTGVAPYLEHGEKTKMDLWRMLDREFGTNFPGFALWFN